MPKSISFGRLRRPYAIPDGGGEIGAWKVLRRIGIERPYTRGAYKDNDCRGLAHPLDNGYVKILRASPAARSAARSRLCAKRWPGRSPGIGKTRRHEDTCKHRRRHFDSNGSAVPSLFSSIHP